MSSADVVVAANREADGLGAPIAPARRRGTWRRQLGSELRLLFRRRRNLAMLVVLASVPVLIGAAVRISSPRPGEGPPFISQLTGNGLFLAFAALTACLPVFLPLAVAVVGGDCIAGEANAGTLRYLLTVPVSRTRLIVVKTVAVSVYTAVAVLIVALVGVLVGWVLFGLHGVTLLSGDRVSIAEGVVRALGVGVYVVVDLLGLVALAVFVSTLTEVPVGAMAVTVGVVVACAVLESIPQLGGFRGLLLTHHWFDYSDLLRKTVPVTSLVGSLGIPAAYFAIFTSAAWARFSAADVTS